MLLQLQVHRIIQHINLQTPTAIRTMSKATSTSTGCESDQNLKISNPISVIGSLRTPTRLLCGPGPGNAHPRVHSAMALPQVGHMDPAFLGICEDVKELLRYVWQTSNLFTIPVSGTGSAAWEATVANLTEPGDVHLVFVNGYFGERHCDMASRYGAKIIRLDAPWGEAFSFEQIKTAIETHEPDLTWICYAETSTGVRQPIQGVGEVCRKQAKECLLLVDSVTAIGGVEFLLDEWLVDACYAGTRVYHHTAPISMMYALREALSIVAEEGIVNVWERHQEVSDYFVQLVQMELGLDMLVNDKTHRLPSLHTIKVPVGIDPSAVVKYCREEFQIEIGNGLGQLAGKVFRVGLMGYNSRKEVAMQVVGALKEALAAQGRYHNRGI